MFILVHVYLFPCSLSCLFICFTFFCVIGITGEGAEGKISDTVLHVDRLRKPFEKVPGIESSSTGDIGNDYERQVSMGFRHFELYIVRVEIWSTDNNLK